MRLIRVGRRTINLEYLIMDEEIAEPTDTGPPTGVIRVTMESGKEFDLSGDEATIYRKQVDEALFLVPEALPPRSAKVGRAGAVGRGAEQPGVPHKRETSG